MAHRKKLESSNEKVGVDGDEVIIEVNNEGDTPSALDSSRLTLAFSLVIISYRDKMHRKSDVVDIQSTDRLDIGRRQ